jgi:hypothetical protein
MMALYVASHYKNSPNDLQLMADAPAHHLFVLLGKTFFFELMLLLLFFFFFFFAHEIRFVLIIYVQALLMSQKINFLISYASSR